MIRFVVPGQPIPTGRPRVTSRGTFLPKAGRDYQKLVAVHAKSAMLGRRDEFPMPGELAVTVQFVRQDRRRCDLDNLSKSVLDALTKAGVWGDDSQVVDFRATKRIGPIPYAIVSVLVADLSDTTAWGELLEPQP